MPCQGNPNVILTERRRCHSLLIDGLTKGTTTINRSAHIRKTAWLALVGLLLITVILPLAGCDTAVPPAPTSGTLAIASTLVPDMHLDVYAFIRQPQPTQLPDDLLDLPTSFSVVSLAMWAVAADNTFTWGGALTMVSTAQAAQAVADVPADAGVWTKQAGAVVYFVDEVSTTAAAAMKSAISNGQLVPYSFQPGIDALSFYPDGGTEIALGSAVAVPGGALIKLITAGATEETRALVTTLTKSSGLQVLSAGLYAAAPVDIRTIAQHPTLDSILSLDAGVLVSVKSSWPGIIISMLAGNAISGAGYEKVKLGNIEVYRGTLDAGGGVRVPVVIRIIGNRIFAAISGQQSYAEALIEGLRSP